MHFTCPYCGNNSFMIVSDHAGASHALCGKCGKVTPFEALMMTHSPRKDELPLTDSPLDPLPN